MFFEQDTLDAAEAQIAKLWTVPAPPSEAEVEQHELHIYRSEIGADIAYVPKVRNPHHDASLRRRVEVRY